MTVYAEGNVIRGRYLLEQQIGEGAMASVWKATHMALQAPVAIKFLLGEQSRTEEAVERFLREARVAAAVRHPHVVQITDFGLTENGAPFMVMEYLEGRTLGELTAERGALPVEEVSVIVAQVLSGLAAVHRVGIVHRDLKPDNLFLVNDPDGVYVKLLDFGVCRVDPSSTQLRSAVREGIVVGTPIYMSPEQAAGIVGLDPRSDLYAVGALMYEALTGTAPFSADSERELLDKVIAGNCPPLETLRPDCPPEIRAFVARAMARDPDARFSRASEMRAALGGTMGSRLPANWPRESIPASVPPGEVRGLPAGKQERRHFRRRALTLGAATGAVLLLLWLVWIGHVGGGPL